jgi:hypothetical protein
MIFVVKSDRAQVVTGLGIFKEGETRRFSHGEIEGYMLISGIRFSPDNLPEGIVVTEIVLEEGE